MKDLTIADLFCGAGGTSAGALDAARQLGFAPTLTAVNHWPVAIETHTANHPGARHLCTSIDDINPRTLYKSGELDLLWASPECTHHSIARGGKPINEQSRATAWCVPRWAEAVWPKRIMVENVPEFALWGPDRNGKTFKAWVGTLRSMGYVVGWRVLCAADYGDPTTRRRLFVQAVRGKGKIVWPEPTHSKGGAGGLKPWVAAREIIDWTLAAGSIYERKKPLSEKTMRRIFEGLEKFGLKPFIVQPTHSDKSAGDSACRTKSINEPLATVPCSNRFAVAEPFLYHMEHSGRGDDGLRNLDRPMPTITTARGGAIGLVEPFLVELRGTSDRQLKTTARTIDEPLPVVSAGGVHAGLVSPFLVQVAHGNGAEGAAGDARRAKSIDEPLGVVCGQGGDMALCDPALLPQQSDGRLRSVEEPAPTVAAAGAIALIEPVLVSYYGSGCGVRGVSEPVATVTAKDRFALVRPEVILEGQRYLLDIRFRMLQPHELAGAQGFTKSYRFSGTKTDQVKQIGNAVPRHLARALVAAALTGKPDVRWLED